MIDIRDIGIGISITIRVQPGAKRNAIVGKYGNSLKISVTAAPENGKANKAVINLVTKWLGVDTAQADIVSGRTSRDKRIHITGEPGLLSQRVRELEEGKWNTKRH